MLKRTYRFVIDRHDKPYQKLKYCTRVCKDIYNQSLFILRRELEENNNLISKFDLPKVIREIKNLEGELNYRKLPAKSSEKVVQLASQTVKSYFKALKDWKKNPSKYRGKPKFPNFLPKNGYQVMSIYGSSLSIKGNVIQFGKKTFGQPVQISIPEKEYLKYRHLWYKDIQRSITNRSDLSNRLIKMVRIIPTSSADYFSVEIVYDKAQLLAPVDQEKAVGIDLGIDNLITMVPNFKQEILIVNGRPLKAINQWFNKKNAEVSSRINKAGHRNTREKRDLYTKRRHKVYDYMHKGSRVVIDWCVKHKVSKIVIGVNKGWKQNVNIGKVNNQKFVSIPFSTLISHFDYKAEEYGIEVVTVTESYTSKCSALDLEPIQKHETYLGRRVHRGLFRTAEGVELNADVNGALNILRKEIGDQFIVDAKGSGSNYLIDNPIRINLN